MLSNEESIFFEGHIRCVKKAQMEKSITNQNHLALYSLLNFVRSFLKDLSKILLEVINI